MSCTFADLADAVKDDLQAGCDASELSGSWTPVRAWPGGVKKKLDTMGTTTYVYAVIGPINDQPLDRDEDEERVYVNVVILAKVDPANNSAMDALGQLWEEVYDRYGPTVAKTVTVGSNTWQCTEHAPANPEEVGIDEEVLKSARVFLGAVRTEWINKGAA